MSNIPSYLNGYETRYAQDPRDAARAWFSEAHFGLFMHDGLYSLLGRHEWVMLREAIPSLQPQTLIAFKQGANGDEDFASPERSGHSLADRVREQIGAASAEVAQKAWEGNKDKHNEICDTLQPGAWGYTAADDGSHHTPDEVTEMLADAARQNCNLLLNTGPLPDGAIHPEDAATLREVGRRIRAHGWPTG